MQIVGMEDRSGGVLARYVPPSLRPSTPSGKGHTACSRRPRCVPTPRVSWAGGSAPGAAWPMTERTKGPVTRLPWCIRPLSWLRRRQIDQEHETLRHESSASVDSSGAESRVGAHVYAVRALLLARRLLLLDAARRPWRWISMREMCALHVGE